MGTTLTTKTNKVPSIRQVIHAFETHYRMAFDTTEQLPADLKRSTELHPSSFPYCGLRHAYDRLKHGDPTTYEWALSSDYFTSVGTAVHTVMQEWVSKTRFRSTKAGARHVLRSDFIGDWKCANRSCGHLREKSQYRHCPKCGSAMHYEELGVKFGKYICGHTDGVFLVGSRNNAYIVDYKTTSSYAVRQHQQTGNKFPYGYNVAQIKTYCALIEKKYGFKIRGWLLVYISRDNPQGSFAVVGDSFTEKYHIEELARLKQYDKHFGLARFLSSLTDLKTLYKEKPCPSHAWYKENQHNEYSPCPLAESEMCFSPAITKHLIKVYKKSDLILAGDA